MRGQGTTNYNTYSISKLAKQIIFSPRIERYGSILINVAEDDSDDNLSWYKSRVERDRLI
jgi:hypothetical protein